MARIRGYIASSLDGFIADRNEELDWLTSYDEVDLGPFGIAPLMEAVGTIVMGRTTFEWVQRHAAEWPYPQHDSIVVTSRPLPDPPPRVAAWHDGVDELIVRLRALDGKDVWMIGGGRLQSSFLARGALDDLEVFVVPEVVGSGYRLWPDADLRLTAELTDVRAFARGMVRMAYRFPPRS
jgi:dihydrofolate reductase